MGAEPAWALLGLTLPSVDEHWLAGFSAGFDALARRHGVALAGGDTTRGPLTVTVTLAGFVPAGEALRRDGARAGDDLWVSGTPGDAAAGLAILQGRLNAQGRARDALLARFQLPQARVALGVALARHRDRLHRPFGRTARRSRQALRRERRRRRPRRAANCRCRRDSARSRRPRIAARASRSAAATTTSCCSLRGPPRPGQARGARRRGRAAPHRRGRPRAGGRAGRRRAARARCRSRFRPLRLSA